MRTRHIVMALALAGAGGLLVFGDKSPGGDIAEPIVRSSAPRGMESAVSKPSGAIKAESSQASGAVSKTGKAVSIAALLPRAELVGDDDPDFAANNTLFQSQNWTPPPPPPPAPHIVAQAAITPPPPQAPPLLFTYIGKAVGDGIWEVFLTRGDKTYIVREQTVIDGQYRVEHIAPPTITLTYLPLKQVQQINIGALD